MRVVLPAMAGASVLVGVLASASGAALPQTRPLATSARVLTCLNKPEVKPASYLVSCADGNVQWKNVTWSSFGGTAASGKGDLYQNNCVPSCADGHFYTYPATLELSKIVKSSKYGPLYSQVTFDYKVKGKAKTETLGMAT